MMLRVKLKKTNMCKVYSSSTTLITKDSENFRPEKFTLARAEKENIRHHFFYIKISPFLMQTYESLIIPSCNERKSEQAHIPNAHTLFENAVYNEWQFQA